MHETNRFFNSDDQPIILAETQGHAKIELSQVPKYTSEHIQAETERIHLSHAKDEKDVKKHVCSAEELSGAGKNHCPVNHKGPSEVHVQQ